MSKQVVTGEQVIIRLSSQDGLIPLVLDFDSIDVEPKHDNDTYRGIGRTISQNQTKMTGYKIKLTRPKLDHYLRELMYHIDMCLESGLTAPKFTVSEVITHTYSGTGFIPEVEFNEAILSNPFQNTPAFLNPATNLLSNNPVTGFVNSAIGAIKNTLALSDKSNFQEKVLYKNCSINFSNYSHKPKEISQEGLVLYSSTLVNNNDDNRYSNEYFIKYLEKDTLSQTLLPFVASEYKSYFKDKAK
jgi:hypothetical protein